MALNVAFYSPGWPAETAQNGIVTYVESLAPAIEARGGRAFVIAPAHVALPDDDAFMTAELGDSGIVGGAWRRLQARLIGGDREHHARHARAVARAALRLKDKHRIDILEIEESFGWARIIQNLADIPVVVRIHGPHFVADASQRAAAGKSQYERRIAHEGEAIVNAHGVTCPSKGLLDATREHYGGAGRTSRAIPNPIEPAPDSQRWRIENCDPNTLLFIGRFDRRKGADIAIQAFAKAAQKLPDLKLVMAGDDRGVLTEQGEILKFQDYASRFIPPDLRARVEFLGRTPRERLETLRRQALAHLSASRFECFAYAVSESLAAGCPVIATRTFGAAEVLEDDRDILCADIDDVCALADHIESLAADPRKAAAIGENGWRACGDLLSPLKIADDTLDFYKTVRSATRSAR